MINFSDTVVFNTNKFYDVFLIRLIKSWFLYLFFILLIISVYWYTFKFYSFIIASPIFIKMLMNVKKSVHLIKRIEFNGCHVKIIYLRFNMLKSIEIDNSTLHFYFKSDIFDRFGHKFLILQFGHDRIIQIANFGWSKNDLIQLGAQLQRFKENRILK